MILSRRRFFLGLVAAPAIVHIGNLMPVKAMANLRNLEEERFLESMTVAYSPVWLVSWGEETVFGLFQPGYETVLSSTPATTGAAGKTTLGSQ